MPEAWLEAGASDVLVKVSAPRNILLRVSEGGHYVQRSVNVFELLECFDWEELSDYVEKRRQDMAAGVEEHEKELLRLEEMEKQADRYVPPELKDQHTRQRDNCTRHEMRFSALRDVLRKMGEAMKLGEGEA